MDDVSIRKIEIIVNDLLSEFEKEGGKLQAEYDDNAVRIIEIEENIQNFKENEDIDFKVFSPRKIDNQNEEKINSLKGEMQNIELANKSLFRQLRYYSDKIEKLGEILNIIKENKNPEDLKSDSPLDDITHVDEKILEYYDSIANDDEDGIEKRYQIKESEVRSGWKIIKEELSTPIENKESEEIIDNPNALVDSLISITGKLENESRAIDEDYFRTKEEIRTIVNSINDVLDKLKNNY